MSSSLSIVSFAAVVGVDIVVAAVSLHADSTYALAELEKQLREATINGVQTSFRQKSMGGNSNSGGTANALSPRPAKGDAASSMTYMCMQYMSKSVLFSVIYTGQ